MKHQRLSLSLFVSLFWLLLPVIILGTASRSAAAPNVTATKTTDVPAGTRKVSGSTINYTHTISNTAAPGVGNDATGVQFTDLDVPHTSFVAGTLHVSPLAFNDSYTTAGNTKLYVNVAVPAGEAAASSATTLLANDVALPVGTAETKSIVSHTNPANGTLANFDNATGSFTYLPNLGFTGTDTFTYTVQNDSAPTLTDTATVTISVTNRVWYLVAGGGGDGRSATPSGDPAAMSTAANAATDVFYVYSNASPLNGPFTLENGQQLIGNGVALVVNAATLRSAGVSPSITNSGGDAVTLGQNNTLAGFNVGNTSGKAIVGGNVGTLTVGTVGINTTGAGMDLTGTASPAVNVVLTGLASGGGTNNVKLTTLGGTVTLGSGALSGSSGSAVVVNGGTGSVSYSGTVTQTTAARVVDIQNKTNGTVSFSGAITSNNGTGQGVFLNANTGATINFTGGMSVSTGANAAFTATGGGTVTATQNNTSIVNTLTTTTGTALNVANTTIGASGLTFRSITAGTGAGSAGVGISLVSTGGVGGLTVTGNGSAGSGGTIQHKTGADGSTTAGIGIFLNSTANVSLSRMQLNDFDNFAIRGTTVSGCTMSNCVISAAGGSSWNGNNSAGGFNEGSVSFDELTGTASITNTSISGGFADNFRLKNTSGTLNRITFDTVTIGANSNGAAVDGSQDNGNDGITIEGLTGAPVINVTVNNCIFTSSRGDLFQLANNGNGAMDLIFTGNQLSNNYIRIATGGGGFTMGTNGTGDLTYNIANCSFRDSVGHALLLTHASAGNASMIGTITGNTVGVGAVANSGSLEGDAIKLQLVGAVGAPGGTFKSTITGNTIQKYNNLGIDMLCGGGAPGIHQGTYEAIITGNTVGPLGTNTSAAQGQGIALNSGTNAGDIFNIFLELGGTGADKNTVNNDATLGDIRIRQRQSTTVHLTAKNGAGTTSYAGPALDAVNTPPAVVAFIQANNTTTNTVTATVSTNAGSGGFIGGAPPLLFAQGGVEKVSDPAVEGAASPAAAFILDEAKFATGKREAGLAEEKLTQAAAVQSGVVPPQSKVSAAPAVLTQEQLDTVVAAALARWEATGLTKEQVTRLRGVTFEVADLPGWYLGEANGNRIRVDNNAGGHGWHVDASAESDALFGTITSPTRRYTDPASAPAGRIDLLTAVLHEFGHSLGLADSYLAQDRDSIMFGQLTKGERRLPAKGQAAGAVPQADGVTHFLAAPLDLGTLPAGKSVTIVYQVQVENPILPNNTTETSSQGTVSGGNFANVLTDDPAVGGAADPTVTLLAPPPTVALNTVNRAQNAGTLVINGTNFSTVLADNSIALSSGTANLTNATATQLTITFTTPPALGALTANVSTTFNGAGAGSSGAVQVANIVPAPAVTSSIADLPINSATVTINGTGFSATAADNTVVFNNGAIGNVSAASATQLTVNFTTQPTAPGSLTANVTVFGGSSGAVQVATVIPVITVNNTSIPANSTNLTINGFGFNANPILDGVTFSGAGTGSGTVSAASTTSLNTSLPAVLTAGDLNATMTSNGISSGTAVKVATVATVVTASVANLAADAATVTINGFGFDTTPGNNLVTFNDGAVGAVTTATNTSLTVTFSTKPTNAGSLTAIVTTNGVASGAAVQVATVIPVVTQNLGQIQTTAPTVTINGFGFANANANNSVTFNLGATGNVTSSSPTSITVTFTAQPTAGNLTAIVTSNGQNSGAAVQVATVTALAITPSTANRAINAPTIVINGGGFSTTLGNNTVVFDNGAAGNVTAASATQLTVSFTTQPAATGPLNATVTVTGTGTTGPTQVATIVPAPTVTANAANRAINAPTLVINGTNFDTTAANNTVAFNLGAVGNVTTATATSLTVTFTTPPSATGSLTADVTVFGGSSGATQVATIVPAPTVTANTANLAQNAPTIVINGTNFDTTAANNVVAFNLGAIGTVTTATATQLTVTFSTLPTTTGSLTAIVTTDGGTSGVAVQVATIVPVPTVTLNTANLPQNATQLIINGTNFSATAANNTVVLSSGTATVTTATATKLTCALTGPLSLGSLTAVVTSNSASSGAPVQVATVVTPLALPVINVGTGGDYPSLTNAGGLFEALNGFGTSVNVTVNIISDLAGELGTNALNEIAGGFTVLIRPSGGPRAITGSSAATLIRLNDADNVTIDGSTTGATAPSGVGGSAALRELTITNTNAGTAACVLALSGVTNGAHNNTFKNLNIVGASSTTTLLGISLGGATAGTLGLDNDNNRVENCSVQKVIFGIYSAGQNAANPNTGTVIIRNDLSATTTSRVRRAGILVFNDDGVVVSENSIGGIDTNESADAIAIGVGTQGVDTTNVTSGGVINATVSRNKINGVNSNSSSGFSAAGIAVAGGAGTNTISNNMITGVIANATSPDIVAGIHVKGVAGSTTRLYYNSVAMTGNRGATTTQTPSYGLAIAGADPAVELKNNIFYSTQDPGSGGANAKSYAIGMMSTTFANLDSNFNTFFCAGPAPGFFRSGSLAAAAGTDYATLALWQAAVSDDANSRSDDPSFINPLNDLHLNFSSTSRDVGTVIATVTIDIDGDVRPLGTGNDIGADEGVLPLPVVTLNTADLPQGAAQLIITGLYFDATPANNTVVLSSGTATVTAATTTQLTCTLTGPLALGSLTAVVTTPVGSSGAPVQVANVVAPPTFSMAFTPAQIQINGTSSLDFTIVNPAGNNVALTGVGFTLTLPAGLTVANASSPVGGGTLTVTAPTGIALTGATVGVGGTLQFSVTVTGVGAGSFTATTQAITSANGGTGTTATATLTTNRPPNATQVIALRGPATSVKIPVSQILAAAPDPDAGDVVTLVNVGVSQAPAHGTATYTGNGSTGFVFYTPGIDGMTGQPFTSGVTFSYTVTDNHGSQATSTVRIDVNGTPGVVSSQITKQTRAANGTVSLSFAGVPGYTVGLQFTSDLMLPWVNLGPLTMNAVGQATFTDSAHPLPGFPNVFYRLIYPAP
ncbi:MAG: cadherin-like domain-containing protein [Verrucomicrobia bacterium]|nr:cadherin-like domain-containing protein [Verrucomicrobiota bacterium]